MIHARLNEKEKMWFSNLAVYLAGDDNYLDHIEQKYLLRYRIELGLDSALDTSMSFESALEMFAKNSSMNTKKSVFLELACITYCDDLYLPIEKKNLSIAAEKLNIETPDRFISIAKKLAPIYNEALALFDDQ